MKHPRKPTASTTQPVHMRKNSMFILFPKTQRELQSAAQVAPLVVNHRIWATGEKQQHPCCIISKRYNQYRPDPPAGAQPIDGNEINRYRVCDYRYDIGHKQSMVSQRLNKLSAKKRKSRVCQATPWTRQTCCRPYDAKLRTLQEKIIYGSNNSYYAAANYYPRQECRVLLTCSPPHQSH